MMTLEGFRATLAAQEPPANFSAALVALWHDARGEWDAAHRVAQEIHDANGAWIHAYLHRKEGDASNAAYWYRRAGQPMPSTSLDAEWNAMTEALLASVA